MFKAISKSFKNAIRGIYFCIKEERSFRIHIIAVIYVLIFSFVYGIRAFEYVTLIVLFALVLFAEIMNSVIEALFNMHAKCYNAYAKNAKDMAAGAVLIIAVFSIILAVFIFGNPEKLLNVFVKLYKNPTAFAVLVLSFIPAVLFIKGVKV